MSSSPFDLVSNLMSRFVLLKNAFEKESKELVDAMNDLGPFFDVIVSRTDCDQSPLRLYLANFCSEQEAEEFANALHNVINHGKTERDNNIASIKVRKVKPFTPPEMYMGRLKFNVSIENAVKKYKSEFGYLDGEQEQER